MSLNLDASNLGPLQDATQNVLDQVQGDRIIPRIWERDHTVWKPIATEIVNRLGWLDSPFTTPEKLPQIEAVVEAIGSAGYTRALLLGMGGSSLAPEVFGAVFGKVAGYLELSVLDTTDPDAVLAQAARIDPRTSLYIAATKSGGTIETMSLLKYFYRRTCDAVGVPSAGDHFIAITDPGSGLADLSADLNWRHTFLNDPDIGGRYSALSLFGMVPARLVGVDVDRLLQVARAAAAECTGQIENAAAMLGAFMGAGAAAGRDKLTLLTSPTVAPLGTWVEQLVAESTGKEGKGILPVYGETTGAPQVYADDRLFVYTRLEGDDAMDASAEALMAAGHPLLRMDMGDLHDLGGELFRWEVATAVAGHCLAINPFDQPDVDAAKVLARSMTDAYFSDGHLPAQDPDLVDGDLLLYGTHLDSLVSALRAFLAVEVGGGPRPYVALQAYVQSCPELEALLQELRMLLRDRLQLATTTGYGPRFLHSTGQLHKGDAGRGLFLQLTADTTADVGIPDDAGADGSSMSFATLEAAQALGDAQALREAGRRVLRIHLGHDIADGLRRLITAVSEAVD